MKQTVGIETFMRISAVIPMVVLEDAALAPDLARALVRGGIRAVEISLQTAAALHAIEAIARAEPDMCVGAGTVLSISDLHSAAAAGASFAVSPGSTPALLAAGNLSTIPYMPGVATASELLAATAAGYRYLSFFPAEAAGGVAMLNALGGPFPQVAFRAAGGVGPENLRGVSGAAERTVRRGRVADSAGCAGRARLGPDRNAGLQDERGAHCNACQLRHARLGRIELVVGRKRTR